MAQACHPQRKRERQTVRGARLGHSERWSSVGQEEALLESESELLEGLELVCLASLNFLLWQTEWRGCHSAAPAAGRTTRKPWPSPL